MKINKKPSIFDYEMPIFNHENLPNKYPNLVTARFFAMELTGVKLSDLTANEKAFFEYIEKNIVDFDITFQIKRDKTIVPKIGSFNSHLIYNSYLLWIPFLVAGVAANNSHLLTNTQLSFQALALNFVICVIGIIGIPTVMFKDSFNKESFWKWYPLLLLTAIILILVFNFVLA